MIGLCTMPVVSIVCILVQELGPDISLIVVELNTLIFASSGCGGRDRLVMRWQRSVLSPSFCRRPG